MTHHFTTADLEAMARKNPDPEMRLLATERLAEQRKRDAAASKAARSAPANVVKLVAEEDRIDRTMPDDGSEAAALRRALCLTFQYARWPDDIESRHDELLAVARLVDGDRNEEDMAIIAAGLARQDIDPGPDLETMVMTYDPDMSEPELRAWSEQMVEVADLEMWSAAASARDRRGASARIKRGASEMRREAYQMAA